MLNMPFNQNYVRSLNYTPVTFPQMDLSVGDAGDVLELKWADGNLPLTETALGHLCKHLDIPVRFAKNVRSLGKAHIIPYLQKQLSNAVSKNVTLVHNEEEIVSVAEDSTLHYRGKDAIDFDSKIRTLVDKNNMELKWHWLDGDGAFHYEILLRDEQVVKTDTALKPLWRWGYHIQHSVLGNTSPVITAELLRMACTNLTYLPAKFFNQKLPWMPTVDERWKEVEGFLLDPAKPKWLSLESFIGKLSKAPASVREVSDARRKLLKLKVDKEDNDTKERVEKALEWQRIKKQYELGNKDVWTEKPTKAWLSKATTPISLFDLYNVVTSEATIAPNTVDIGLRQNLLVYGGKLLTGRPDLSGEQQPPVVDWKTNA